MIYVTPIVRKVIGLQYVLKEERKVAQVEIVEMDQQTWCHDLAKQLSHYLFIYSFSFLFDMT